MASRLAPHSTGGRVSNRPTRSKPVVRLASIAKVHGLFARQRLKDGLFPIRKAFWAKSMLWLSRSTILFQYVHDRAPCRFVQRVAGSFIMPIFSVANACGERYVVCVDSHYRRLGLYE